MVRDVAGSVCDLAGLNAVMIMLLLADALTLPPRLGRRREPCRGNVRQRLRRLVLRGPKRRGNPYGAWIAALRSQ
jgi:hypothetical protein